MSWGSPTATVKQAAFLPPLRQSSSPLPRTNSSPQLVATKVDKQKAIIGSPPARDPSPIKRESSLPQIRQVSPAKQRPGRDVSPSRMRDISPTRTRDISPIKSRPPYRLAPMEGDSEPEKRPLDMLGWYLKATGYEHTKNQRVIDYVKSGLAAVQQTTDFTGDEMPKILKMFSVSSERLPDGKQSIQSGPRLGLALATSGLQVGMLDNMTVQLFYAFDADGNGSVEYHEFAMGLAFFFGRQKREKNYIRFVFRMFDLDGDGQISEKEIFTVFRTLLNNACRCLVDMKQSSPAYFSDKDIRRCVAFIMLQADTDKRDGFLTVSEFEQWAPNSPIVKALMMAFAFPHRFIHEVTQWLTNMYSW